MGCSTSNKNFGAIPKQVLSPSGDDAEADSFNPRRAQLRVQSSATLTQYSSKNNKTILKKKN